MLFSFSLQKLLVLISIIGAVWYGFRLVSRIQKERERQGSFDQRKDARKAAAKGAKGSGKEGGKWRAPWAKKASVEAQEMVECKVCGAYVPSGSPKNCGRADCPY